MSKESSFNKINYYLRPNKQVERKIMIEIIQKLNSEISIMDYCYVGMGSIYYYDFILMHKFLGLKNLTSIDNKTTPKRFEFNKPYDFINFENTTTSDYLSKHQWDKNKNLIWLDYDERFILIDYLDTDLSFVCKNSNNLDILFISINSTAPRLKDRKQFIEINHRYISPKFNDFKFTDPRVFHFLVQDIVMNKMKDFNLYNENKCIKLCSFTYKDSAPMYTLGIIFSKDISLKSRIESYHSFIDTNEERITQINIPNITYKEKFYLDSKISYLKRILRKSHKYIDSLGITNSKEKEVKLQEIIDKKIDIELTPIEIENYLNNYLYFPQYYEGII